MIGCILLVCILYAVLVFLGPIALFIFVLAAIFGWIGGGEE